MISDIPDYQLTNILEVTQNITLTTRVMAVGTLRGQPTYIFLPLNLIKSHVIHFLHMQFFFDKGVKRLSINHNLCYIIILIKKFWIQ